MNVHQKAWPPGGRAVDSLATGRQAEVPLFTLMCFSDQLFVYLFLCLFVKQLK